MDGPAAFLSVVERVLVHVHPDELVGRFLVHPSSQRHRVPDSLPSVVQSVAYAFPDDPSEFASDLGLNLLADNVPAQRKRQPCFPGPPLPKIKHLPKAFAGIGELSFVNQKPDLGLIPADSVEDLVERHGNAVALPDKQTQGKVSARHFAGDRNPFRAKKRANHIIVLARFFFAERHENRAVAVAHARPAGKQGIPVQDMGIGVNGDRRNIQFAPHGSFIQGLDILKDMLKAIVSRLDLAFRHGVEHEGVIRVRGMTKCKHLTFFGRIHRFHVSKVCPSSPAGPSVFWLEGPFTGPPFPVARAEGMPYGIAFTPMSDATPPDADDQSAPELPSELTPDHIEDAVIRLAGNSQDGIQTIGGFLARLAGRSDQDVMTFMTIPATISGGPSIFQVRIGSGEVLSAGDMADFLVAFYQHSYEDHLDHLREGGVLLYDSDHVNPDLSDKRFVYVGVPVTGLTVEAVGGTSKSKGKNIFILGLLARIFNLDVGKLKRVMAERFRGKHEDVLRNALVAFDAGFGFPVDNVLDRYYKFHPAKREGIREQVTMDGNQAIAYGLIAGGVRYGAAYPITPWSTIMEMLRVELPKYGGIFVQSEDELGAISTALGFSYSGHLAVTGSSGPGMSLKMEALSWAVMAEIPLVVVNIQRGGPSTGLPTSVEQSDLLQAINGSHGDSPRVVLAPQNVEDCFYVAIEAAKIARKYSVPVIILSDQALATRIEAFDEPNLDAVTVTEQPDFTPRSENYAPYPLNAITQHAPPGTVMKSGVYPTVTGLEHDEQGHPSANPGMHMLMTAKRRDKVRRFAEELPCPIVFGDREGDVLLVGWGSTWGPLREAVKRARSQGQSLAHLHIRHLNPLPNGLPIVLGKYRQIFVVEMNDAGLYGYGQLASVLRARFPRFYIRSITKTDGLTFKVREILEGVRRLGGDASASVSAYPYATI